MTRKKGYHLETQGRVTSIFAFVVFAAVVFDSMMMILEHVHYCVLAACCAPAMVSLIPWPKMSLLFVAVQ